MVAFNTAAPAVARIPAEVETHPAVAGRIGLRIAGYDRRIHPRRELSLRVSGRRLDHSAEARREPALNLNLHDVSLGGLRATSQSRLAVGERVAVYFPPTPGSGPSHGWDAVGRVIRCDGPALGGAGCTVAVEFDPLAAA